MVHACRRASFACQAGKTVAQYDLLVGADGAYSAVRQQMMDAFPNDITADVPFFPAATSYKSVQCVALHSRCGTLMHLSAIKVRRIWLLSLCGTAVQH